MSAAKIKKEDLFGLNNDSEEEDVSLDEEEQEDSRFSAARLQKQSLDSDASDASDDDEDDEDDENDRDTQDEAEDEAETETRAKQDDAVSSSDSDDELENEEGFDAPEDKKRKKMSKKLKKLSPEELEKFEKARKRTGVCYLSRIPPFMRPKKVRSLLEKHAEIGRIYLVPEDAKIAARRKKYTKNKRANFVEGWVEFKDKKRAKALAEYLNTRPMGGKRTSPYHDELWSIKYLNKFKWHNLTEHMAHEKQARKQRLRNEIAQANRENKTYIQNVERAKMLENMEQKKRKREAATSDTNTANEQKPQKVQRTFAQRAKIDREVDPSKSGKKSLDKVDPSVKSIIGNIFSKN
ncbi:u3 snoRNP-associated protein Esf2 [Mucor ambiguus]|uniref:18S rRNA factor 2 n=1 Tax=Mucor ambiguus TaxID=91626 RepID=A0A0C9LVT0_9FUNG|nr:u3 snoRNP-associated protein Esf2 [Mucor ambiguus]